MPSGFDPASASPALEAQLRELRVPGPAVVGEVVDGQHHGHVGEEPVAPGDPPGALEQRRAGMPVVDVEDVERRPVALEGGERRAAQDGEPPRVVGVVVEPVAVERRGHVDEAQPVAVRGHVDDRDVDGGAAARVRDRQRRLGHRGRGDGHRAVAGQEHVDRGLELRARLGQAAQRAGQGVDHVGEPARLRPGLALGREERDTHRHARMLSRRGREIDR